MGAYKKLIKRVEKIDPKAAKYLKTKAKLLPSFEKDSLLAYCFVWDNTPQGFAYWDRIQYKLLVNKN